MIIKFTILFVGFLFGVLTEWIYFTNKREYSDKELVAMYKERIKCLEHQIKELKE